MRSAFLGTVIAVFSSQQVAALDACRFVTSDTKPGLHKVVQCASGSCLLPYDNDKFSKGDVLRLAHVFGMKTSRKSLAIVKVRKSGVLDKPQEKLVHLKRDGVNFSCLKFGGAGITHRDRMRGNVFVSFKNYDDFHRYFINNKNNRDILEREFHTFYHNGKQCVRTDDSNRRAFFLLNDDGIDYSPTLRFLAKIFNPRVANAREGFDPDSAEVSIRTYQRRVNQRGCIDILQKVDADVIRLTVVDVESSIGKITLRGSDIYHNYEIAVRPD